MKHVVIVVLTGIYQGKFCDFHGIYMGFSQQQL